MAFTKIENVAVRGVSACVPKHIEENIDLPVFSEGEAERVIAQTSIVRKHTVENGTTAGDLCERACNALLDELGWGRDTVEALILVTSAPDYLVPPTACILQGKLGLPESTLSIEIRQGCPGWVIGLTTLASLLSTGNMKRGILLCGDTPTLQNSPKDKETRPLFGDAGTATALEFDPKAPAMEFEHGTKGKDFKAIYQPHGGMRNPFRPESLIYEEYGPNHLRRPIDVSMDGMNVFSFGLSTAPKSVMALVEHYGVNLDKIDYFLMHQANHYMNEKIRRKLKIPAEKAPYSMQEYGNPGSPSIPLTLVTQCREDFINKRLDNVAVAFGVGLAWGSVHFITNEIACPEIVLYE